MEAAATKFRTRDIAYIAVFVALMAICSWISIPTAIPFTLQTMAVFLAVGLLGGKRGTLAVTAYVLLGAVGAPVFANFSGGIGILLGQTGGYILGFIGSALVMWAMERFLGGKLWGLGLNMLLGLLVCYAFGTAWYCVQAEVGLGAALAACVYPFIPFDLIKMGIALLVGIPVRRRLEQARLL